MVLFRSFSEVLLAGWGYEPFVLMFSLTELSWSSKQLAHNICCGPSGWTVLWHLNIIELEWFVDLAARWDSVVELGHFHIKWCGVRQWAVVISGSNGTLLDSILRLPEFSVYTSLPGKIQWYHNLLETLGFLKQGHFSAGRCLEWSGTIRISDSEYVMYLD